MADEINDTFAPPIIASMVLGECCVAHLCQRRNGDLVIVVDAGEPCPACWTEMKRLCNEGFAKSVLFGEEPSPAFAW